MEIGKYTEWLMDNCEIVYDKETGEAILWRYDCEEYSFNGIVDLYFKLKTEESVDSPESSEENILKFAIYCNKNYTFHEGFCIWINNTNFKDRKDSKQLFKQFKKIKYDNIKKRGSRT